MSQKKLKELRRKEKDKEDNTGTGGQKLLSLRQLIKKNWKFLVLLLLGAVLLYFNSLKGDFVSDDYAMISQNSQITSFKYGLTGWLGGLINWFLAVTFGVGSPIPFHICSLFCYLLVLLALFVFAYLIVGEKLAMITTLLFTVLPIHVEAISWISGRPYLINAFSLLVSLIFLIYYLKTTNKKYLYYLLGFLPLAFFAEKTRFVALPLLAVLYWVSFDHPLKKKIKLGKILLVFGSLFLAAVVFMWPQLLERINTVNSGINASDSVFYSPFFQYPTAITKYLQLLWFPMDLTLYHTMFTIPVWLNWMIILTYLALVIVSFFKDKRIFFALAFIFLASAPSMAPVKISWLVAERYVFLGSVGWAIFLAILWDKINSKFKALSIVLLMALVLAYGVRVFIRNINWQTNHNLWVNTCKVSPSSHNAWNNIGDDYDKLGQYENSVKGFNQSVLLKPNYADAYHNMANIFYKMGRLDLARDSYKKAISINPEMYQSYLSLIQTDLIAKEYDLASEDLESLKKVKPDDAQVWYIGAYIDIQKGEVENAREVLKAITAQFPNYTEAVNLLKTIE